MRNDKLAVIGVGLIGSSCALAARAAGAVSQVVGIGRSRANLDRALASGAIDRGLMLDADWAREVADAELVLIAIPVIVLPLTHLERDSVVSQDSALGPWLERTTGIARFDTLFARFLQDNIVDTKWILPPELRRIYKRNGPAMVPDPDFIGQASLWNPRIEKKVPEPVQSRIRKLASFTDARTILVPVGLQFYADTAGLINARLGMVLIEARVGEIRWRTYSEGRGASADAAVRSALMASLPVDVLSQ